MTYKIRLVRLDIIDGCFSKEIVEEILFALEQEVKCHSNKWIIDVIESLRKVSPASLKITLRNGDNSGVLPSPGSLTCINYSVILKREEDHMKEVIERNDEFEFEIGTGAVISYIESCVTQLLVNQSAQFVTELPSRYLLLAAAGDFADNLANQSLSNCFLKYSIKLLRVMGHLEDRMEQVLFSHPPSKQRSKG